jgi:hypothetical protein
VKQCGLPGAYVVGDLRGVEWFVCEAHGGDLASARWIVRTPIAQWFRARGLPWPIRAPEAAAAREAARCCSELVGEAVN